MVNGAALILEVCRLVGGLGRNSRGQLIFDGSLAWTPAASVIPASAQCGQTTTLVLLSH